MACDCGQDNAANGGNDSAPKNEPWAREFARILRGDGKLGVFESVSMIASLLTIFFLTQRLLNE